MGLVRPTQADVARYFPILAQRLAERKLPCEKGPARFVRADEFMLMHRNEYGREVGFKHVGTRNYVFLRLRWDKDAGREVWALDVPLTMDAFHLGWFDPD